MADLFFFLFPPPSSVEWKKKNRTDRDADREENGIGATASAPADGA